MATFTYQERFKTEKGVFDEHTERALFSLQSKGVFEDLVSPFKVGKESNVFIGISNKKKIIIKIYRVQNCDFKRMYHYIKKDPRYQFLKHRRRDIIFAWTQREYKNLMRAWQAGINTPKPLAFKDNIIVEEMIGKDNPAPPLKDSYPQQPTEFFQETILQVKKLYQAGLIHGDLSSFNILNDREKPYLIDFSQATLIKTPNADELLERDLKNVISFFQKLGMKEEFSEVLKNITS